MLQWPLLLGLLVFIFGIQHNLGSPSYGLRVALHAQVAPSNTKVVGSVITTDGMLAALRLRHDISTAKVFYPFAYQGFMEELWDLVLIEGWFPMIHEFIQITRSHSPEAIILFFCLDPIYPGLDQTLKFDVDGFLTNSRPLAATLSIVLPTEVVLLAADPEVMKPLPQSTAQKYTTVYVGAGGNMLDLKPLLRESLVAAVPYGLAIYGSGWEKDQGQLKAAWKGVLPRYNLSQAYSDAHIVLAFTIEAQRQASMVNNRVFEAMSCGAILLSDASPSLEEIAAQSHGGVVFFNSSAQISQQLAKILAEPSATRVERGKRSRSVILRGHTWGHRIVQILSFYYALRDKRSDTNACCTRPNCPSLLWIAAADVTGVDSDYDSVIRQGVHKELCFHYRLHEMTESDFRTRIETMLAAHARVRGNGLNLGLSNSTSDDSKTGESFVGPVGDDGMPVRAQSDEEAESAKNEAQTLLQWLLSYDVLFVAMRPNGYLDALLEKLSSVMAMRQDVHSKPRMQKWVAFMLPQSPHAFTSHSSAPRESQVIDLHGHVRGRSPGGGARGVLGVHSGGVATGEWGKYFDLLLFKDHHDRTVMVDQAVSLGKKLCTIKLHNAMRCDHVFGLGSDAPSSGAPNSDSPKGLWSDKEKELGDVSEGDEDDDQDHKPRDRVASGMGESWDVIVCFWHSAGLCGEAKKHEIFTTHAPDLINGTYHILLVGGWWSEWLNLDGEETVVTYERLPFVTHVPPDRPTTWAHGLFRKGATGRVLIISEGDSRVEFSSDTSTSTPSIPCTTWPFLLAARARAHIILPYPHTHYLALANEAPILWNQEYLNAKVRTSVSKLSGMAAGFTGVAAHALAAFKTNHACTPPCAAAQNQYFLHVIVELKLSNFIPGRDGQVCFASSTGKKLLCLIRQDVPFLIVGINVTVSNTAAIANDTNMEPRDWTGLEVLLRSNMFADIVASTYLPLPLLSDYRSPSLGDAEYQEYAHIANTASHFLLINVTRAI